MRVPFRARSVLAPVVRPRYTAPGWFNSNVAIAEAPGLDLDFGNLNAVTLASGRISSIIDTANGATFSQGTANLRPACILSEDDGLPCAYFDDKAGGATGAQALTAGASYNPNATGITTAVLLAGPADITSVLTNVDWFSHGTMFTATGCNYGFGQVGRVVAADCVAGGVGNAVSSWGDSSDPGVGATHSTDRLWVQVSKIVGGNLVNKIYVDGVLAGTLTTAGASIDAISANATIGKSAFGAARNKYRRIMVWPYAFTDADVAQLDANLATGRQGSCVIFAGNSMTDGYLNGGAYPEETMRRVRKDRVAYYCNLGISGDWTTNMLLTMAKVTGRIRASDPASVVACWEGRNDLEAKGKTRAQALANLQAYGTAVKAAGAVAIVVGLPPTTTGVGTYEADRKAINATFRASPAPFDAFVDIELDAALGAAGANLNTTYYNSDGIHMVTAGYRRLAALAAPVISRFLP